MNFLKYLLVSIFIIFPIGELLRIELGNNIVVKPLDLIVGISTSSLILYSLRKRRWIPKTYLNRSIIFFSVISLFSLVINITKLQNIQFLTALLYWVRFISYVGIYYLVLRVDKNTIKKNQTFIMISGTVFVVLGYIQFFLYANLRNLYYLGWDEHNYRLFSTFLDPNFAGAFLVLFFLFIFAKFINSFQQNASRSAARFGAISILTFIAILLTYSRSALLMLVVCMISYLILIKKKKYLLPLLVVLLFIIVLLFPTFNKENTNLLRTSSSFARFETYNNSFRIIYDNPIVGIGFNAYRYAQESYGFRPINTRFPDHAEAGTDNSFLFVTATTGIIGFFAYLFIWYSVLRRALLLGKNGNKIFPPIVISSSIGLFINGFFINSLFFPSIMLWMWVIIGFMDRE